MVDSEKKYRMLFELSPVGISIIDNNRNVVEANQELIKIIGMARDSILNGEYRSRKYIHSDGSEIIPEDFPSSIAIRERKTVKEVEIGIIKEDGETIWTEVSASPIEYDPNLAIVITKDITQKKTLEKKLIESEERFRLASKATGFGAFSFEFKTRKAHYSEEFLSLYGLSPDDTIILDSDLVPVLIFPEDKLLFMEAMNIANDPLGTGILDIEFRIIRTDGKIRWLRTRGQTVFSGKSKTDKPLRANGFIQDITEQKNSEKALKESELKYRLLFENSGEALLLTNPDGSIYSANPEACKIYGRSVEELCRLGRSATSDLNDPRLQAALKERRKTGKFKGILNQVKKDGTIFPAEVTSTLFTDGSGNIRTAMIIRDITERVNSEKILMESEAAFRSIFENSMMGISQVYPESGLIRINRAYAEMYGFQDTNTMLVEIENSTVKLYSKPDDRKKVLAILEKDGFMPPSEFELRRRDGEHFWALVAAKQVKDDNGKLLFLQAEHINITGLKNTQKAFNEIDERHRLIMENSGLGIAYYSIEGKILMLNNVALRNLGGKPSDYIGKNLKEVFGNEAGKLYIERLQAAALSQEPVIFEDYVELEGIPGWYLSTQSRILNQNGEVDGIQVIADNITELKSTEIRLKDSQLKYRNLSHHLEEILEKERSEIAMNLHDDLGQRLTALDLDLAWIRGRIGVQSASVKKKLIDMHRTINEIVESTKEISSFLRPAILFDLGLFPAIKSLLDKFEKKSGIDCLFKSGTEELNIEDQISMVIYRVLQEALTNIARHSEASNVVVNISLSTERIEMVITDNGKGIDDKMLTSSTSMGITGIKERVRAMNGKVKIKGKKGSGTTINVTIPINNFNND